MNLKRQPYRDNPLLRSSYSLIAPIYDLVIARALRRARARSLMSLETATAGRVLLSGVGTGLDLPLLPSIHQYTGLDFNAAMLSRARQRGAGLRNSGLQVEWVLGDAMALPFDDGQFDHVVLHLILAIVPRSELCLGEAARVVKAGGTIIVFDKFLRPNSLALMRRALTPLSRRLATRMDVVFEEVAREVPQLEVVRDLPLLAGGWFRAIVLRKKLVDTEHRAGAEVRF
jgi:phosphatidylethanolamine/phosphatidyl-N-methylethanolamine N-methyltransferase